MKQTSTPLTRWANSRRPELRMMGGGEYATTEANNATMTANLRDGVDPYRGMALAPPKSGGDEAAKSSGGVSGASMLGTGEFNIPMPQLRDGGELHMSTGGQHRGFLNVLEGAHDTLGDWANMAGDYLSPAGLLPQPRGLTAPASAHQGPGVMDRVAELAKPLMPMRGNSSQPERFRATPTSVPAAPAPTVQTQAQAAPADHMGVTHTPSAVTGTDRAAFLARNPAIAARYEAERNRGYNPNASPSTTAVPAQPSLHSQGVQQPWRTVLTQRTDSEGQAIHQKQYKQGNTYSDRPVAPAAPAPVQTASPTYSTSASARRAGQDTVGLRHGGELYMTNGGVFDTLKGYFGGQKKVLDKRMAAAEAPQAPPPPPPPQQPVNPRVTPDNPAGIQFRDGGELYMTNGGGMLTTLRNYFGGQKKVVDKRMAAAEAPQAPPPPPPPPQPVNPRATPENPAGIQFAHGGSTLRTGHGGVVPGTGTGDKIPAKYEPGEFVVSNDMLDAEPELRQHLRGLREEVLAEKGMTVAEADAKALNGGRGLRAESSLGDTSVKAPNGRPRMPAYVDMTLGEPPEMPPQRAARPAPTPAPKAAPILALPDDSYGVNARNAGRAADVQREADVLEAAKTRAAEMHAAAKGHADFEARKAAHGDGRYGLPPNPPANGANPAAATPAPTAPTPASKFGKVKAIAGTGLRGVPMLGGAIETGLGIANGDARQTAWGVADTAAGAAMFNPVTAPIATPYLAMRGAYEGARALTDMASEYGLRDKNEAVRKMLEGTPPRNTQKPATSAAPVDTSDIEREKKNKAILDAAENLNAPGKPGETRNFDRNGNLLDKGQEMVYTGPKMGWQQRTSEAHLAKLNADDLKWQADNDRAAAAARARTAETLKRFEMQELLAQPMSKHRRAQVTELIKSRESNQVLRDNALLNADTLRTNNIETNQTTRRGHDLELEGKLAPAKLQAQIRTAKAATLRGAGGDYTKAADLWALRGGDPKDFLEPAKAKAEAVRSAIDTDVAKANQGKGMFDGKFIAFDDDGKQLTDKWSEGHAEQLMAAAADSFRQTNKRDMTATEMKQHMNEIVAKTKAIAGMRKRAADRNNSMWNTVGLDKDVSLPTDIPNSAVDPEEVGWWDGLSHGAKVQRGDLRFGDQVLPGDTDADAKAYLLHIAQQRRAANKEK